jgi:hypothetical protein
MARFVSPHRNFSVGVHNARASYLGPDGKMVPEVQELRANFTPDLRNSEDTALAKSAFVFRGMPIYEDGSEVDPSYRISVFDSEVAKLQEGWTEDDEALVIAALRATVGQGCVEVIPAAAAKPWNGYDSLTDADKVVELALAIDADLAQVAQYERENLNRPAVVEALQAAAAERDETITVSA